jgi:hypothetical protein
MRFILISFLLLLGVSCSNNRSYPENLLVSILQQVKGNEYWRSLAYVDYARFLAEKGRFEECDAIAAEIPNYRRALVRLAVPESMVAAGKFEEARKTLLSMGEIPRYGVGPQESEIVSRMIGCAEAAGCLGEVVDLLLEKKIKSAKNYDDIRVALNAELQGVPTKEAQIKENQSKAVESSKSGASTGTTSDANSSSKPKQVSKENALLRRMALSAGSKGIVIRLKGLMAVNRTSEAHELLSVIFMPDNRYPFANLADEALVCKLGWRCGWDTQPDTTLDRLKKLASKSPGGLETGYAGVGEVIVFAAEMQRPDIARALLTEAEEKSKQLPSFFRTMAISDLARAAKLSGFEEEAGRLLFDVVQTSGEEPNPRSKALGCFWALMAALKGDKTIRGNWEDQIKAILKDLPAQYERIASLSGGGE